MIDRKYLQSLLKMECKMRITHSFTHLDYC